ncbi:hypothetical protein CDD80_1267 [Ophiocordyceps camponoti-rufipedis]|uniref:Uncharacterized protein n=1 Tax=Ophiocordyceps camponoti-rufipedis TaxID=2004952 RepID=A0A2C5ZL18_9HYPO|nr:hypothetical protein CDD80_1267 [Ophiocordyceps camponoti-rufipedis]
MATVQDRKAPNAGTKAGNTPSTAHPLTANSEMKRSTLAATLQSPSREQASEPESSSNYEYNTATSSSSQPRHAEQAPRSNVSGREEQTNTSDAEGFDDPRLQDGLAKALNSEPGSIDDPSRLAEAQLKEAGAANPSVTGLNQPQLPTGSAYDSLSREVSS